MNTMTMTEYRPHVAVINGSIKTTSLKVAEHFKKQHKNVLQAIEQLECSEEFNGLNFQPVEYIDAKGEKRPCYEMTKDGFVFLVMGFTGKDAAKWKEAYINAFNKMEAELQNPKADLARFKKSVTQSADRVLDMIASLPYHYGRFFALRGELNQLKKYVAMFEEFEAHGLTMQELQFRQRNPELSRQTEAGKLN